LIINPYSVVVYEN